MPGRISSRRRHDPPRASFRIFPVQFQRDGFAFVTAGPATQLTVTVESPGTAHEIPMQKLPAWLEGGGKSPAEQAVKVKLREVLGRQDRAG
jgi:hypothetical protein